MQVFAMCMECQKELGHPTFEPFIVPYYDDRIAFVECSRGHKSAFIIQNPKFEVLLESGVNALTAGFTMEAAASFSAALERFYEFCVNVLSMHREMTRTTYDQMFKVMARQSERQLGAFLLLYALEFGTAYTPDCKIIEFRNSVIHKGAIPNPEEAKDFCGKVCQEIRALYEKLEQNCSAAINDTLLHDLSIRSSGLPKGSPRASADAIMFFKIVRTKNTFDEALEEYLKARATLLGAISYLGLMHRAFNVGHAEAGSTR